nr:MAG TPA: hypothetical protein [Caudoviricetes sp.]
METLLCRHLKGVKVWKVMLGKSVQNAHEQNACH